MVIYKCANIKYPDETMLTLVFNRRLRISTTTALYLTAEITTTNWTWTDATTSKNVNIATGAANYTFDFKYTLAMPAVSGKYSIAVTFKYYSDAARTVLISTDYHTFELHFYHGADFATHVYDHAPLDSNLTTDKGLMTLTMEGTNTDNWKPAIIEGIGSRKLYKSTTQGERIVFTGSGANRFFVIAYGASLDAGCFGFIIDGVDHDILGEVPVKKAVFYLDVNRVIKIGAFPGPAGNTFVDGVYVFNPIP